MADSDDEPITLSTNTLDALKEFYADRDAHSRQFEKLKDEAEATAKDRKPLSMGAFTEDWNESQFWYSDETAGLLASELVKDATADTVICVVSAPSVFVALKNIIIQWNEEKPKPKLYLLEHDQRFAVFPEFVFYDFQQPIKLPAELKGKVDRVICDPPFLSEDCQTKAALSVRWMSRAAGSGGLQRLILCTGERMEQLVTKLYKSFGLQTTTYLPLHARGLSNEFYCYANFESDQWEWKQAGSSS